MGWFRISLYIIFQNNVNEMLAYHGKKNKVTTGIKQSQQTGKLIMCTLDIRNLSTRDKRIQRSITGRKMQYFPHQVPLCTTRVHDQ